MLLLVLFVIFFSIWPYPFSCPHTGGWNKISNKNIWIFVFGEICILVELSELTCSSTGLGKTNFNISSIRPKPLTPKIHYGLSLNFISNSNPTSIIYLYIIIIITYNHVWWKSNLFVFLQFILKYYILLYIYGII